MAVPMCGVPYHAAEGYIGKLIRKGFKVAICEQMEDPRLAKKLVRREVTRVVTPGTAADSSLGSEENNFLAAMLRLETGWDLPRWIFRRESFERPSSPARARCVACKKSLEQFRPRELLYGSTRRFIRAEWEIAEFGAVGQPSSPEADRECVRDMVGVCDRDAAGRLDFCS